MKKSKPSGVNAAVFPGSFDPLTYGHVDLVERTLDIFDRVVVGVLENPSKQALFSTSERVALIQKQFKSFGPRVKVASFSGLLVDFVKSQKIKVVIRGLRAISDYDYEAQMALINRRLSDDIETFFLMSREEHSYISSTVVKQVASYGGEVKAMVPGIVAEALKQKYKGKIKR